ncbi:MAG: hypothetical protein M1416_03695 [Candidatus Pacearchaeota archaeon]|nr:hypothetical protein [Candidatus Pacearchaeota archaeon]
MKLSNEKLIEIINYSILPDKDFQEALDIVRKNSSGKIWLIGGFLYKNLAHSLYGSKKSTKDFDLIVEKANSKLFLPENWIEKENHFSSPKFISREKQIDFIPLSNIYYIKTKSLVPCINNFLEGGGLNIHCLAYDILEKEILGDIGIRALEQRIISVYNLEMLEYGAKIYGKTLNEIIKTKAEELGFESQLI